VAAVENTAPSPGNPIGTGGARSAGEQYRWQWSRPLVSREGQGPGCGAFECVLQIARTSVIVRELLAQPSRTAVYGPVRTVVWQGSAGDRGPGAPRPHERQRRLWYPRDDGNTLPAQFTIPFESVSPIASQADSLRLPAMKGRGNFLGLTVSSSAPNHISSRGSLTVWNLLPKNNPQRLPKHLLRDRIGPRRAPNHRGGIDRGSRQAGPYAPRGPATKAARAHSRLRSPLQR